MGFDNHPNVFFGQQSRMQIDSSEDILSLAIAPRAIRSTFFFAFLTLSSVSALPPINPPFVMLSINRLLSPQSAPLFQAIDEVSSIVDERCVLIRGYFFAIRKYGVVQDCLPKGRCLPLKARPQPPSTEEEFEQYERGTQRSFPHTSLMLLFQGGVSASSLQTGPFLKRPFGLFGSTWLKPKSWRRGGG